MLSTNGRGFYFFLLSSSSYSCYFLSLSLIFFSSRSSNVNTICHAVKKPVKQRGHLRFSAFGLEYEEWCSLHAGGHSEVVGYRSRLCCNILCILCNIGRKWNEEVLAMWLGEKLGWKRSVNLSGRLRWKQRFSCWEECCKMVWSDVFGLILLLH